jgi:hypothetical protein
VSDQQTQSASGEAETLGAGPATADTSAAGEPVTAAAGVEKASLAPRHEETSPKPDAPKVDAIGMETPKVEASKAESSKMDASKMDAPKMDAPKIDAAKPEAPRFPGNVTIMSPGDRPGADAKGSTGKRRFGAMAAVVALATVAGALGGALATAGVGKLIAGDQAQASVKDPALESSVARLDAEIVALKASLEHSSKTTTGQINRATDRLDKVEKAQAEPAAKLARLSEAVDKLRAAQAPATTVASAREKDVTGSIPQQAVAAAAAAPVPAAPPKTEIARLPTVEGWRLRDVAYGGALIESRRGTYEVYAGDPVPGLGRVDAIRKQDGRWVVVTSKGLIVAR